MKTKLFLIFFFLLSVSFIYSNDKGMINGADNNFVFNYFKSCNRNASDQIINFNDATTKEPILTRGNCINFIATGGISLGGSLILAGLGGLSFGLYNFFINNPTANAFIIIGGVSFALSGIFLVLGIVFLAIGVVVYSKYYKTNKVSLFIDSIDDKCNFGLDIKI